MKAITFRAAIGLTVLLAGQILPAQITLPTGWTSWTTSELTSKTQSPSPSGSAGNTSWYASVATAPVASDFLSSGAYVSATSHGQAGSTSIFVVEAAERSKFQLTVQSRYYYANQAPLQKLVSIRCSVSSSVSASDSLTNPAHSYPFPTARVYSQVSGDQPGVSLYLAHYSDGAGGGSTGWASNSLGGSNSAIYQIVLDQFTSSLDLIYYRGTTTIVSGDVWTKLILTSPSITNSQATVNASCNTTPSAFTVKDIWIA